jgi:hypothetical protein
VTELTSWFVEPSLSDAYVAARARVRGAVERRATGPCHRIVVLRGSSVIGEHTLSAHPVWGSFAIVGRHTRAGIVVPDNAVDSRHLLIRSILLRGGALALRVLDLQTEHGFVVADGSSQRSILAIGPVVLSVGQHVLVALPSETRGDPLPSSLPSTSVRSSGSVRAKVAVLEGAMSPYRANARHNRSSVVRLMPRLVMAGDSVADAARAAHTITLARDGCSAQIPVTKEDLSGGVIIGRSRKCTSELLRRVMDNATSRVHVLVLREDRHVFAYDLASTSGLYQSGAPVSRVLLASRSTLTLGTGSSALSLIWEG